MGNALQCNRQRIGDLLVDVLRASTRPFRKDDGLVLGDVGDSVFWILAEGVLEIFYVHR